MEAAYFYNMVSYVMIGVVMILIYVFISMYLKQISNKIDKLSNEIKKK